MKRKEGRRGALVAKTGPKLSNPHSRGFSRPAISCDLQPRHAPVLCSSCVEEAVGAREARPTGPTPSAQRGGNRGSEGVATMEEG